MILLTFNYRIIFSIFYKSFFQFLFDLFYWPKSKIRDHLKINFGQIQFYYDEWECTETMAPVLVF
jgi:hypothetical protein